MPWLKLPGDGVHATALTQQSHICKPWKQGSPQCKAWGPSEHWAGDVGPGGAGRQLTAAQLVWWLCCTSEGSHGLRDAWAPWGHRWAPLDQRGSLGQQQMAPQSLSRSYPCRWGVEICCCVWLRCVQGLGSPPAPLQAETWTSPASSSAHRWVHCPSWARSCQTPGLEWRWPWAEIVICSSRSSHLHHCRPLRCSPALCCLAGAGEPERGSRGWVWRCGARCSWWSAACDGGSCRPGGTWRACSLCAHCNWRGIGKSNSELRDSSGLDIGGGAHKFLCAHRASGRGKYSSQTSFGEVCLPDEPPAIVWSPDHLHHHAFVQRELICFLCLVGPHDKVQAAWGAKRRLCCLMERKLCRILAQLHSPRPRETSEPILWRMSKVWSGNQSCCLGTEPYSPSSSELSTFWMSLWALICSRYEAGNQAICLSAFSTSHHPAANSRTKFVKPAESREMISNIPV